MVQKSSALIDFFFRTQKNRACLEKQKGQQMWHWQKKGAFFLAKNHLLGHHCWSACTKKHLLQSLFLDILLDWKSAPALSIELRFFSIFLRPKKAVPFYCRFWWPCGKLPHAQHLQQHLRHLCDWRLEFPTAIAGENRDLCSGCAQHWQVRGMFGVSFFGFFLKKDLHNIRILGKYYPLWLIFFKWVETTKQFLFDGGVLEDSNPKSCFCSRQPGVIRDKEDTVVLEAFPTELCWFPISTHFSQRFWLVLRLSP